MTYDQDAQDAEDMRKVSRLIDRGRKCPARHCSRMMSEWFGCESPDCPVPLKEQAKGFISF